MLLTKLVSTVWLVIKSSEAIIISKVFSYAYTNLYNLGIVEIFDHCFMLMHTIFHSSVLVFLKVTSKITS